MASVASELIEEVTAHAQSDSLEDAREICADSTYFPNNLRIYFCPWTHAIPTTRIVVISNLECLRKFVFTYILIFD